MATNSRINQQGDQPVDSDAANIVVTDSSDAGAESETVNESWEISDQEIADLKENSGQFIGKWNTLVSTTNWEKGRIIIEWRESLIEADEPASKYSDEAWSRLVGSVTSQHVGRLRRVYQRFGETHADYAGAYWTHFHAALDWNDAEMWLEGVVQNKWSVSQMRNQRWETMGKLEDDKPDPADEVSGELDEDFEPVTSDKPNSDALVGEYDQIAGPRYDDPDFGDEDDGSASGKSKDLDGDYEDFDGEEVQPVRPFENLAALPEDMAEAFENFKLAILRHKSAEWEEISRDDVVASLDALKHLADAPT